MQRNLLHRGIVLLAGMLLCLHTVIPHVHGSLHSGAALVQIGEKTDGVNEGLLHLIKHLLSSDLGEDHLENFTPELQKDVTVELSGNTGGLPALLPVLDHVLPGHASARQTLTYIKDWPPDDPVVNNYLSRGPPAHA